jgi:hypothetical protein
MGRSEFINQNKLGLDECAKSAKNVTNKSIEHYNLWNNYSCIKTDATKIDNFAAKNVNLHFRNGYGFTSACDVDTDTELRLNGLWTSEKAKTQLFTRFYTGNPDLSKGTANPVVESPLVQGDNTYRLKVCANRLSENDFDRFVPLVPCLESEIQNPDHIVLPFPHNGIDSRQVMRNLQPRYNKYGKLCTTDNSIHQLV